jgi:hypothetical protein
MIKNKIARLLLEFLKSLPLRPGIGTLLVQNNLALVDPRVGHGLC